MKPNNFHELLIVIGCFLGLSVAAAEFYSVRELAAALVIFGVLFGMAGTALLILISIEEAALKGVAHLEARLACVRARHADTISQPHGDPMARSSRWN